MAGFVQSLGLQLVDSGNKPYDAQQLSASDVIAFYFSAHWCPPCRGFTPLLKKFVETLQGAGDYSLKVIFVSRDRSEVDMWRYMHESHGKWLAVAYSSEDRDKLSHRYGIQGIPSLAVINQVGQPAVPVQRAVGEVSAAASSSTQVLTTYLSWRSAAGAASAAPAAPSRAPGRCSELPQGARVKVRGLTGAPEHNGTEGTVLAYDAGKQRYHVQLGEKSLALRAANLLQVLPVRVRTADGEGWRDAEIVDIDDDTGEVILQQEAEDSGEPALVRARLGDPAGPVLRDGARVVVHGLQAESARQWNEHVGKVLEYDEAVNRYVLEVAPETQLKIRPENLRLWPLC